MKLLVTGGAGYVGSHVTEQLVKRGHDVVVLDNLYQGHRAAVVPGAQLIEGDLADTALLDDIFSTHDFDGIFHFASYTLVSESWHKPMMYLRTNVVNGLNLLDCAVRHGVNRFILSSTANLFGAAEVMPITEAEPVVPGSPYGESKYILERILHWLDATDKMRYVALRYFNACGSSGTIGEDHRPETHLIPILFQVALGQRETFTIYGQDYDTPDGTCIRDYVHVLDLAEAHILSLEALKTQGSQVYNLGTGHGYSVLEVLEMARRVTGHPIPAAVGERRPGDPPILVAGSKRLKEELGWTPTHSSLEEIVTSAWQWHRAHPNGYG